MIIDIPFGFGVLVLSEILFKSILDSFTVLFLSVSMLVTCVI